MASKHKGAATTIPLHQAVGKVLAHDITEIRPGQFKGPAFKKGHVVREEDLAHLRRLGKEHIFVLHMEPGEVHEDEAAVRLARALSGPGVTFDPCPAEGKISLKAAHRGLLKVQVQALMELNLVPHMCCASRHNNTLVNEGEILAATRVIPLVIDEKPLGTALQTAGRHGGIFAVKPLSKPDTGLLITGNEVYEGLVEDKFGPLVRKKLQAFGCAVMETQFLPDDRGRIAEAIVSLLEKGAEMLIVAGGMSVDPDDVSRMAIADAGAEDVVYGTPVLPGAMFLYGRFGRTPVLGLPACVLYYNATVFDLILPRVLAGERITRIDLAAMAHGGLCLDCEACRYPACPFGKG
jgi:molybdenum cofactor synthesis domain-containing protein